jgi:hypothetical protein
MKLQQHVAGTCCAALGIELPSAGPYRACNRSVLQPSSQHVGSALGLVVSRQQAWRQTRAMFRQALLAAFTLLLLAGLQTCSAQPVMGEVYLYVREQACYGYMQQTYSSSSTPLTTTPCPCCRRTTTRLIRSQTYQQTLVRMYQKMAWTPSYW